MEAIWKRQGCAFSMFSSGRRKKDLVSTPPPQPFLGRGLGSPTAGQQDSLAQGGAAGEPGLLLSGLVLFRLVEVGSSFKCNRKWQIRASQMQAFSGGAGWRKDMKMSKLEFLKSHGLSPGQEGFWKLQTSRHLRPH